MGDPTLPYTTYEALTCSIDDLLPNGTLCGPDCASWTMGESSAATNLEGCQAAVETSGTLTCVYHEVAGVVVLEVGGDRSVCLWFVLLMTRQRVSATSAMTPCLMAVVWPLTQWSTKLMGIFQQLPCAAVRRVNLTARHKKCNRSVRTCRRVCIYYEGVCGFREGAWGPRVRDCYTVKISCSFRPKEKSFCVCRWSEDAWDPAHACILVGSFETTGERFEVEVPKTAVMSC